MKKSIIIICVLSIVTLVFAQYPRLPNYPSSQRNKPLDQRLTALEQKVEELTNRIKTIEEKLNPTPELKKQGKAKLIKLPFEIGQIVYFKDDDKIEVIQITDRLNTIVEVQRYVEHWESSVRSGQEAGGLTRYPGHMVYDLKVMSNIWIRGLNTSNWADESVIKFNPNQLFKVTGTQSYKDVSGNRATLFVLEPYND
jgi:hypothetical protein